MLKSPGIHRGLSSLVALALIAAAYRPVLAQSPGCTGGFDADNDVDLLDYAEFSNCVSGPGGAGCACFDLNGDVDIDLSDFNLFWQGFTGPPGECGAGQADCGGGCIDVWWDENNCGGCGKQCASQDHCWYGSCAPCGAPGPCFGGFLFCDGLCTNVGVNPSHCGCCGLQCGPGQNCQGGLCWDAEPCWDCRDGAVIPGDFDDDGDVDLADFAEFQICALGPAISQTAPVCTDAWLDADDDVDLNDFAIFEGCFGGPDKPADPNCACLSGETNCDGMCVDTASDYANCGDCGNLCVAGLACVNGSCSACVGGLTACCGACVALTLDPSNCGGCGIQCPENEPQCIGGICQTGWRLGNQRYLLCGGVCVDSWVDVGACGGCGISCAGGQTCVGGVCQDQEPCWDCSGTAQAQTLSDCYDGGGIDLRDLQRLLPCLTGPGHLLNDPQCRCADLDGDGDSDLLDLGLFQLRFEEEDPCGRVGDSCLTSHGTPGCGEAACCTNVCAADPFCCHGVWDAMCVTSAMAACGLPCDPPNDRCQTPTVVTDGTTAFSNVGATTDGPFEGERCDDLEIGADIWFTYTATCTGMAIVSLCGSEYDTTLAVYNGSACPTRPRAIQCSDDDCRDLESRIIVPVVQGQTYLVRVGGYDDETGTGVLSIRCTVDGSNDDVCKPGGNECGLSHRTPGCTDVETCESMCDNDPSCCDVTWHGRCGCPLDEMSCDGTCISTTTDNANCGTCGNVCAAGTTCLNGTCSVPLSCPPPLLHCGTCVDPLNDGRNCGACFVACATNEYCSGGTCVPSEPCGPECEPSSCPGVDLWWDSANCGTCGNVCPPQTACAWGTCEGICIDCE